MAIKQATAILESDASTKGVANLDEAQKAGVFLQLTAQRRSMATSPNAEKALQYLRNKASSLNSKILTQLAEAASDDPFAKVKKMIEAMVNRLTEEAAEEAAKHGTCTKDMARDKANLEKDEADIAKFSAAKDKAEGDIAELTDKINGLTEALETLAKDVADAKATRSDENAENTRVEQESEAAIKALDDALSVLNGYYSKVPSFIQTSSKASVMASAPEYEGGEYTGIGGE